MKDRLLTFLGFLLFLVSLPFLIVLLIVYIIPVVIVESIREKYLDKKDQERRRLERLQTWCKKNDIDYKNQDVDFHTIALIQKESKEEKVYDKLCRYCPNAKHCHDDCVTCDKYEEAMDQ